MNLQPLDAGQRAALRQSLRKRISNFVNAGSVLLGLLVVSAVVGLILSAASDMAGVAAVRAVAGILAVTAGLVLVAILATLAQAVLLILQEEDQTGSRSDPPPVGNPVSQSSETDSG